MSTSIITPNMNLIEPTVGIEAGPQYALDINNSLTLIDQHDHTPGKGVQITPGGININTNLPFNDNAATGLQYASFFVQPSATTTLQAISVAPAGSPAINELFYTDNNGTQTQITKDGAVNVITSSIPGESYATNAGTFIWTQTQSVPSLPTTPAGFDIGSITIRPYAAATTLGTSIVPAGSLSVSNALTLPLNVNVQLPTSLPASTSFVTISQTGQINPGVSTTNGITNANIAAQTITNVEIANKTITAGQVSDSAQLTPAMMSPISNSSAQSASTSFVTTSGSFVDAISGIGAPATVTYRPMFIMFQADNSGSNNAGTVATQTTANSCRYRVIRSDSTVIVDGLLSLATGQLISISGFDYNNSPAAIMNCVDLSPISGGTYSLQLHSNAGGHGVAIQEVIMTVLQL